ncbi:MAG: hypothetical protein CMH60_00665 [Myxococcales bacterium]|nr:hypothetical protein [Myxococcales bacterium]|tara:strand:+ start:381 stop:707 length:327 start_codon:yes stop_codon:yes gene_type:complete
MQSNGKVILYGCAGVLLIYGVFFSSIAGQSLGSHMLDVWRSPIVQEKLTIFAQSAHESYRENIVPMAQKAHRTAIRTIRNAGPQNTGVNELQQSAQQLSELSPLNKSP